MAKTSNKLEWSGMPVSNETLMKQIKTAVESTYVSFQRINQEKESLKEIFEDINAQTGIPKRVFNFLAKSNYDGTAHEHFSKNEELQEAYDALEHIEI